MKKTIEIDIEVTPEETALIIAGYSDDAFARLLNAFGSRMKAWGIGSACMQFDNVGMSPVLNDDGRLAASMIAKAAELETGGAEQ